MKGLRGKAGGRKKRSRGDEGTRARGEPQRELLVAHAGSRRMHSSDWRSSGAARSSPQRDESSSALGGHLDRASCGLHACEPAWKRSFEARAIAERGRRVESRARAVRRVVAIRDLIVTQAARGDRRRASVVGTEVRSARESLADRRTTKPDTHRSPLRAACACVPRTLSRADTRSALPFHLPHGDARCPHA